MLRRRAGCSVSGDAARPHPVRLPRQHLPLADRRGRDAQAARARPGSASAVDDRQRGHRRLARRRAARSAHARRRPRGAASSSTHRARQFDARATSRASTRARDGRAATCARPAAAGARRSGAREGAAAAQLRSRRAAGADVPDPYYGGARRLRATCSTSASARCRGLLAHIRARCAVSATCVARLAARARRGRRATPRRSRGGDINDAYRGRRSPTAAGVREDAPRRRRRACSRARPTACAGSRRPRASRARGARGPATTASSRSSGSSAGRAPAGFDEELGRGLAALHRAGAPASASTATTSSPRLPQANTPAPHAGPSSIAQRRLEPLVAPRGRRGRVAPHDAPRFDAAVARLRRAGRPDRAAGAPARRPVGRQRATRTAARPC